MGRYIGPKCRLCRREGVKLFLKGDRCFMAKCAVEVRNYPPGMHPPKKISEYGEQLREKQRLRRMYGLMEKQFRNYYHKASMKKGITGELLLQSLETRLDNIIYLLGFASSRDMARQVVKHGHITVNGKRVNVPSYQVKEGSVISVVGKDKSKKLVQETLKQTEGRQVPSWLALDKKNIKADLIKIPERSEIQVPVNENVIVELYSK